MRGDVAGVWGTRGEDDEGFLGIDVNFQQQSVHRRRAARNYCLGFMISSKTIGKAGLHRDRNLSRLISSMLVVIGQGEW